MGNETKPKTRKSGKTLQTAREAGYFGKKMLKRALDAQEKGAPIGWSMVTWWQGELVARAMGVELVFPENYGAYCASVRQAEPHLERCAAEGYPSTLCGYARNCIGYAAMMADNHGKVPEGAPGGGLAKPKFLLASGVACDARYKWFQALTRYIDAPVWTLDLPQTGAKEYFMAGNKELNISFMVSHLRRYVEFLEELLGTKLDYDKLREMVQRTFKTLALAHEVDLLRRAKPSPMVSTDFWSIMIPHLYLSDDPEAYEFYRRVYDEVKQKVDNKIGAIPNEKYRMVFCELPPWHTLGFFDELAERFGIAMVMESWGYHAITPFPAEELEGVTDPLELIARLSYRKWSEYNSIAVKYGVEPGFFMAANLQYAEDYRADGFLGHPLMSCRPATYVLLHARNMLEEKLKVPGVLIEGDIVDLRVFNEEEAISKMEAFVETMDHYRDLRKEAGMAW
ncbi:MAG: 2-hydroxyacyl-CoA dehydratase [Deltaproteobacteria bacterium]|nr:2-hydroxyacyl-CoA dehydratase [Deltaproteobacteria bacterium]